VEWRLFDPQDKPEWLDPEWWVDQPHVNHLGNWVHESRLNSAAQAAVECADFVGTTVICDVGSCDGGLLDLLPEPYRSHSFGYDVIDASIEYANDVRGVNVTWANVVESKRTPLAQVIVCTEMLEHLENPRQFLHDLKSRGVVYGVFSSPKNETLDLHEWNHAWVWDMEGYARMFEECGWEIVSHTEVDWSQQIVAKNV
jgi:hypothetical protein